MILLQYVLNDITTVAYVLISNSTVLILYPAENVPMPHYVTAVYQEYIMHKLTPMVSCASDLV